MALSRRAWIAGAAGAVASSILLPRFANAAEFTYKFANNLPLNHPVNIRAKQAADKIREETAGRVDIKIFANSALGTDPDVLSQVRTGGVEFFLMGGLLLASLVPIASIDGIPYAFSDYPAVWRAVDGKLGQTVRSEIAKFNLVAMERQWDNGFHQITTRSKPIHTPDDMAGLKIRTGPSALQVQMCTALGASPTSLSFNELYTALQTGLVDGQLNALVLVKAAKLYEVQSYCALTNHMWSGFWFLANKPAWERLPENLRNVIATHINAAAVQQRGDVVLSNKTLQQDLTALGLKFTSPDPAPFRARLAKAGFYRAWKEKLGAPAWDVLESYAGKLA
ncbi:TRAP-type transport system periplasmic protein [Paraburkholderia sacchari]|uniref:TRAP transporter substrate-binding protein n=1 Tax=Paraburkholderia sacchari TaxID=159450 RepID=UPI0039A4FD16